MGPGQPSDFSNDIALEDWDALFDAVVARLKLALEDSHPRSALSRRQAWAQARVCVLECVQALEQLHVTAAHQFSKQHPNDANAMPSVLQPASDLVAEEFPRIQGGTVRALWKAWHDELQVRASGTANGTPAS